MSNVSYRDYPRALQANVPHRIGVPGDYWQLVKCIGEITLEFDQGVRLTRRQGAYGPGSYREVLITSPVDQTITISLGVTNGVAPGDNDVSFAGTINANIAPITVQAALPDVAIAAGTQQLLASLDANRRELVVRWPSTASGNLRVGDSTTAANRGVELEPGDAIIITGTSAVYGFNVGLASASASLLAGRAP